MNNCDDLRLFVYYNREQIFRGIYHIKLPLEKLNNIEIDLATGQWQNQLNVDSSLGICLRICKTLLENGLSEIRSASLDRKIMFR